MRRFPLLLLSLLLTTSAFAAENDLSVGFIARLPRIDYVWNSTNPTFEGWPLVGSTIHWVATVRWLGSTPLRGVPYRWMIDGGEAGRGTLDFAAESSATAELPWTWTFTRHNISFEIDPDRKVAETEERNNRLVVPSNSIGIGLYVEKTFWAGIQPTVKSAVIGATTFDDWMQRQVRRFNEMAQYAVFPETPDGVFDRWRIDDIHVVDDGALPLAPPYSEARDWGGSGIDLSTLYPNVRDHTVDMQWGFPASALAFWPDASSPYTDWILTIGNSLLHEWSHARTMIDVYAWNLSRDGDFMKIDPAPPLALTYFNSTAQGLMHYDWGHIDRFTAAAMNRMVGRRAISGNYNEPWDLGWFLSDLPAHNRVRLLRPDRTPIANRKVILHRSTGEVVDWKADLSKNYGMVFSNTPGMVLTTDKDGFVDVGHNPFSDGKVFAFDDRANGMVIVQIEDGTRRWAYLESLQFNLAYWGGKTDTANYDVVAGAPICGDQLGPGAVQPRPEALVRTGPVRFRFPVELDVAYDFFYAVDGGPPTKLDVPAATTQGVNRAELTLSIPDGRVAWWFTDKVATFPCPAQHSSIYAFDHDTEGVRARPARR